MSRPVYFFAILAVAGSSTIACTTATRCTEGRTVPCACPDGVAGAQTCLADGTLSACVCSGDGSVAGPDAALDGGPVGDTGAPADAGADSARDAASREGGASWELYDGGFLCTSPAQPLPVRGSCEAATFTCIDQCTTSTCENACFDADPGCERCYFLGSMKCGTARGCQGIWNMYSCCLADRCVGQPTTCEYENGPCVGPLNELIRCTNQPDVFAACDLETRTLCGP